MARCHDCNRFIKGNAVYWRVIEVGSSTASGLGYAAGHFLPFLGTVRHYGEVEVCGPCADRLDERCDRRSFAWTAIIWFVVGVLSMPVIAWLVHILF